MKTPNNRNTPINLQRLRRWVTDFSSYRYSVSEDRIRDWINQFDQNDHDLAARILDCVEFFSHDQIAGAFRSVLKSLEGWDVDPKKRKGRWRFVAYSASAGESGDTMLHKFRHANNLAGTKYNDLFIHRSDILRAGLGAEDTIVLVDDFVGTGDQTCESWNNQFGELLTEVGRVYLVVVAACDKAVTRVSDETGLEIVPHFELDISDNIFEARCRHFNRSEKDRLLQYCEDADPREPRGKGECGLLVVFSHTCPNNSLPVLHVANSRWEGLFRRYN